MSSVAERQRFDPMSHTIPGYLTSAELRTKARAKLGQTAQPDARDAHATEAMGVLYELAAAPDTAADALALLHELQVHQVELELLAEAQVNIRASTGNRPGPPEAAL